MGHRPSLGLTVKGVDFLLINLSMIVFTNSVSIKSIEFGTRNSDEGHGWDGDGSVFVFRCELRDRR